MSKAVRFGPEQVAAARKLLQELPVKEKDKSKQELAAHLGRDIQAALKKGYSAKDLSELLKENGLGLSASLIKAHADVRTAHKRRPVGGAKEESGSVVMGWSRPNKAGSIAYRKTYARRPFHEDRYHYWH